MSIDISRLPDKKVAARMIERLASLQGTDPGMFVLAVHSFVEACLREIIEPEDTDDERFSTYINEYKQYLKSQFPGMPSPRYEVLNLLAKRHISANEVRHRFASLAVEEAREATQHLLKFCELTNINVPDTLAKVQEYLRAWEDRRPLGELSRSLAEAGFKLQNEKNASKKLTEQLFQLEPMEREYRLLQDQKKQLDSRISQLEKSVDLKDGKVEEMRVERGRLNEALRAAKRKAEEFDQAKEYAEVLSRMTVYTRTRGDYERSITRLTQEQKKILFRINLNEDFLIKGSAGTGKTLVLLKAIEKAKGGMEGQSELDLPEIQGSVALLTYTNTLVKYDQYVASLLSNGTMNACVSTADAFLLERLRELNPKLSIGYQLPEELARQNPAAKLPPKELATEIESFIWGNDISYEEYVIDGIDRRGMKHPLMKQQRIEVWSSAEAMKATMEASMVWTRNSAALLLAQAMAANPAGLVTRKDYIFIDEAQDLPAAVLKALKACTNRAVILAGDADQSIYQPGFSFKRAGLDISGRTRILHTNFRNTIQLHEFAERYRYAGSGVDDENQPEAFRDGPAPELFEGADTDEMISLLEKRIGIFLDVLGYSPENICIVVPREDELKLVSGSLSDEGLSVADIREHGFDFRETGSIRLTTMHSAKGLDFPVVLLFLPQFHVINSSLDPVTSDRLARNLIYVAMTRAMDHLNVFLREGTSNPALVDLIACFESSSSDISESPRQDLE